MSKEACQKEIICLRVAISKLDAIANQLDFLCEISETNYRAGLDVDLEEIKESTLRTEEVIKITDKIVKTLS